MLGQQFFLLLSKFIYFTLWSYTIEILKIWTYEKFAVITLKFKQGFIIE